MSTATVLLLAGMAGLAAACWLWRNLPMTDALDERAETVDMDALVRQSRQARDLDEWRAVIAAVDDPLAFELDALTEIAEMTGEAYQ